MFRNVFVMIAIFAFMGCAKKEAAVQSTESQDLLNQSVQTQTELAPMQDESAKAALQVQTVVTEAASQAALPQEAGLGEPTDQEIQQALQNAGLYSGKIDGNIGPKTTIAIKDFQEKNGLKADGRVGPKTWAKLQPFLQSSSAIQGQD